MLRPMAKVSVAKRAWIGGRERFDNNKRCTPPYLDEALAEEDLDDLLEDRQQTTVVDANAPAQQREHVLHLATMAN